MKVSHLRFYAAVGCALSTFLLARNPAIGAQERVRCQVPAFLPDFWNANPYVCRRNNCYNYANNKRTDTFAQPGRGSGYTYRWITCREVASAAARDEVEPLVERYCPWGYTKLALFIAPGCDYHWYRQDRTGMWSHKPGQLIAIDLDDQGLPIENPETADRGYLRRFCGYFCSCSSAIEGEGHEDIRVSSESAVQVTLLLFLGREDPSFLISDEHDLKRLSELIARTRQREAEASSRVAQRLGEYRGIRLEPTGDLSGSSWYREIHVLGEHIEVTRANGMRQEYWVDQGGCLQAFLLRVAMARGWNAFLAEAPEGALRAMAGSCPEVPSN